MKLFSDVSEARIKQDPKEKPVYFGFGGWLYIVAIGLILTCFQALYYLVESLVPLYESGKIAEVSSERPMYGLLIVFESISNLFNVLFPVYLGVLCLKQNKLFPKMTILFYVLMLVVTIIDYLLANTIPELVGQPNGALAIMKNALVCIIWIPYFIRSERVKNTYVM